MNNKVRKLYYDMITVEIFPFRNGKNDIEALSLRNRIMQNTDTSIDGFVMAYANRVLYTMDMHFEWDKNMPDDVKEQVNGIEKWWDVVKRRNDPLEAYEFYIREVPNYITNGLNEIFDTVHEIWKPDYENTPLSEEDEARLEETDPNS